MDITTTNNNTDKRKGKKKVEKKKKLAVADNKVPLMREYGTGTGN